MLKAFAVPPESIVLVGENRPIDYVDSFHAQVRLEEACSVDVLTAQVLTSLPRWSLPLFALRNWLVAFFGLERGDMPLLRPVPRDVRFNPGEQAVFFHVSHRTEEEIVMAESDRHLDFRLSVRRVQGSDGSSWVQVTTVVWFNNVGGRLYFSVVKPFHQLIVGGMVRAFAGRMGQDRALRGAVERGKPSPTSG